jgi:hypothetical protein
MLKDQWRAGIGLLHVLLVVRPDAHHLDHELFWWY